MTSGQYSQIIERHYCSEQNLRSYEDSVGFKNAPSRPIQHEDRGALIKYVEELLERNRALENKLNKLQDKTS